MVGAAGRAASLVGVLVLAGCFGGGPGEVLETEAGAALDDVGGNETAVANLTFAGAGVDATVWANGSAGMTAACPMACWSNVTDISAVVPRGVPVHVWAELRLDEPRPSNGFHVALRIQAGDDAHTYWGGSTSYGEGRVVAQSLFARGLDPVEVAVSSTEPDATEPGAYSLEVRTTSDPRLLPAGAAAGFDAEAQTTYVVRPAGSTPLDAVVYGPDDAPVARLTGTSPATFMVDVAGEHVVYVDQASANVTLVRENGTAEASLRPVGVTTVASEVKPVAGATPTSWTFDASAAPIVVRFALVSALPAQAEPTRDRVEIESPVGVVLDEYVGCETPCAVAGFSGAFLNTTLGDPALVAGEYTVTVTPGGAEAALAAESYDWLDRSR